MIIRKQFKFELAHIVRNARTRRCSKNIHWHSYLLELFIGSTLGLDSGQMVLDFGIVKNFFNDFVDSFDHSFMLWNLPEDKEVIEFAVKNFERVIVTPFASTAEMQAKMFALALDNLLRYEYNTQWKKDRAHFPDGVFVKKARVHETKTGFAEYDFETDGYSKVNPETLYPIKIFWPGDSEKILNDKNNIRVSEGIASERKTDLDRNYNTLLCN